jgi:hypothetical protein
MAIKNLKIQQIFIESLRRHLGKQAAQLPQHIAQVLGIGIDAAYRRLRCTTEFSLTEAHLLTTHYKMPQTVDMHATRDVLARVSTPARNVESMEFYLKGLFGLARRQSERPNSYIYYAAKDFPHYYMFGDDLLAAFKLFFWIKNQLNSDDFEDKKFDPADIPEHFMTYCQNIHERYITLNRTEIWTYETVDTVINEINYALEAGYFKDKKQALTVIEAYRQLIFNVKELTKAARKRQEGEPEFNIYHCENMMMDNSILATSDQESFAFINFGGLSYLQINSNWVCQEVYDWTQSQIMKSDNLTVASERKRNLFFEKALVKIDALHRKVEAMSGFAW